MPSFSRFRSLPVAASLAVAAVLASACGSGDDADADATTTVHAPTTTAPATTTEPAALPPAPLTGVPVEDLAVLDRPAVMVKIDNADGASCEFRPRPQAGLHVADLMFEIEVEGGITRFAVVFHSTLPELLGPVRSARSSDIDLITGFNVPLLAWSGSNANVAAELRRIRDRFVDVGHSSSAGRLYFRDRDRCAPTNLFVPVADLYEFAGDQGNPPSPVFAHRDPDAPPATGQPAAGVRFSRGVEVAYVWNAGTRTWDRTQKGTPHVSAEGGRISPANIVVLETEYRASATPGSPMAVTVGEGKAFVYQDSRLVEGAWRRASAEAGWELVDLGGDPLRLSPGRTVVHLVRAGAFETLDAQAAARFAD